MQLRRYQVFPVLLALLLIASAAPAAEQAAVKSQADKFLRFAEDDEGGGKLEVAIATYTNPQGVAVHLISAVHVGDTSYYDGLNKTFASYDALLYEMVKPKEMGPPLPGHQSDHMVGMVQRFMKDVLELDYQLDAINYQARNFVHADLDAETFARLQAERGESLFTLMLRQMLNEMQRPRKPAEEVSMTELLVALMAPDRPRHFKLILARQFEDLEAKVAGLDGPDGSVLLTERNKAAIRVLQQTIEQGKRNIGVFYGAAHMPDLAKRLAQMGFTHQKTEWRTAWDMTPQEGDVIIRVVKKKPETQPAE